MPTLPMHRLSKLAPYFLSVLRIFAAGSFLTHGTMKLFNWPAPFEYPLNPMLYTAGILEVVGGLLLIIGLFSRPTAFLLSGLMAFATLSRTARTVFFLFSTTVKRPCFIASSFSILVPQALACGALMFRVRKAGWGETVV